MKERERVRKGTPDLHGGATVETGRIGRYFAAVRKPEASLADRTGHAHRFVGSQVARGQTALGRTRQTEAHGLKAPSLEYREARRPVRPGQ